MLTFISGWKTADRDKALLEQRDVERRAIFFLDDSTGFLDLLPNAPLIELYRLGRLDFKIGDDQDTLVRVNYDTDHDLIARAVTHVLLTGADAQIVVTFDAVDTLFRLFPALRGSFRWHDYLLESQTSLLTSTEVLDAGIVPDEDDDL